MLDTTVQELAEQIDQNMDFVEQKLEVFNKAIDLQSASVEEAMNIKFMDIQQALEESRIIIETDIKKRNRGGNDFVIERVKIYKSLEDLECKNKMLSAVQDLVIKSC